MQLLWSPNLVLIHILRKKFWIFFPIFNYSIWQYFFAKIQKITNTYFWIGKEIATEINHSKRRISFWFWSPLFKLESNIKSYQDRIMIGLRPWDNRVKLVHSKEKLHMCNSVKGPLCNFTLSTELHTELELHREPLLRHEVGPCFPKELLTLVQS